MCADMNANEQLVMTLLAEHGELTAQQVIERSGGKLIKGAGYATISALIQCGRVVARDDGSTRLLRSAS